MFFGQKMESTNMPSLKKTGVQKTPALQKEPEVDDLHGACPNNACEVNGQQLRDELGIIGIHVCAEFFQLDVRRVRNSELP